MEIIGKVKHRNLVPLASALLVIFFRKTYTLGDERYLIYEHMYHGSLEMWLN